MEHDAAAQLGLVGRIALGLILGAIVGWEREMQREQAGFRTYALVGLGAALFTVASGVAFGASAPDPTRIAAQIVTGIGFIGGGAILKEGATIRGLSTAASMWAVGAIGLAAGAGLWVLAIAGTALVVFALEVLDRVERRLKRQLGMEGTPRSQPS
jgi:putative Mg2+ transporter-C (MgtC) family protein